DDFDVGHFEVSLIQRAEAVLAGAAEFGRTGRGRFLVKIAAHALEAAGVVEPDELNLKAGGAVRAGISHVAGGADGDVRGAGGNRLKTALQRQAVAGDDSSI